MPIVFKITSCESDLQPNPCAQLRILLWIQEFYKGTPPGRLIRIVLCQFIYHIAIG